MLCNKKHKSIIQDYRVIIREQAEIIKEQKEQIKELETNLNIIVKEVDRVLSKFNC